MKYKKSTYPVVLLLCLGILGVNAQEIISTSGADTSGIGGSVFYTVGQVVYSTHLGTTGSVAAGVQQPYVISEITSLEVATGIQLICFPNPTSDLLSIEIENYSSKSMSYLLYDINGKLLDTKNLVENKTTLTMAKYPPAIYFLKIFDNQKEAKTFRIIKN